MWTWEQIILQSIQIYLTVQFIFLISYLSLDWHQEFQGRDIFYIVSKIIQYLIHLIFFPKQEDNQKYFKYHIIFYLLMDMYGLFLIGIQIEKLWFMLSQLLIGLSILSCSMIYKLLFTILSYLRNLFTCQKVVKLQSLLENYIISQICFSLFSFKLIQFYDNSSLNLGYMILRLCQYFITYVFLQIQGVENALQLHYILDTLMNIIGLLDLNNDNIFFWFTIGQIALGCFHYCYIVFSLMLFTILNYYSSVCEYIKYRLSKLSSNNNQDRYINNFMRLYLITQLILTIQIVTVQYLKSEFTWYELIRPDIIYFILRIVQYLFHFFVQLCFQDVDSLNYFHYSFNLLMDIYGLYVMLSFKDYFWNILFQILLGFILYYWILIELISFKLQIDKFSFNLIESPFQSLQICFFMLQMIFYILAIKFNWSESKCYLIFRSIAYGLILINIKLAYILRYQNQNLSNCLWSIQNILAAIFNYIATFFMLIYGGKQFQTQNYFTNLLILSQLFVDLIIIGSILLTCCQRENLYKYYLIWLQTQKAKEPLNTYKIKDILWWLKKENIVITEIEVQCSICYESLFNGQETCKLLCHSSHEFHKNCLQQWEEYNPTCPICRRQIRKQIAIPVNPNGVIIILPQ